MKTLGSKVAAALSFAHLTGIGSARAEDDKDKKDEDKDAKRAKAEDDKKDDEPDDKKDKESAEGDDPDKKDDDDDAGAEDDDDEEEMRGNSAAANARRRERARCASIFASKAAGKNPALAANLAFNTSMTRKEALTVLESTPAAIAPGANRSARNPQIGIEGGAKQSPQQALAERWDKNLQAANPSRRR